MNRLMIKMAMLAMPLCSLQAFEPEEHFRAEFCMKYNNNKFMIIDLIDLDSESFKEFTAGNYKKMLVRINEGDKFPISFYVSGEVFSMEKTPETHNLTAIKEFYVRCKKKDVYRFSFDRKKWYNWNKFFSGELNAGIFPSESLEKVIGEVSVELNFSTD